MSKRANGEGTIVPYKVKGVQKGWRTSIMIGFKPDGKPDRKQFYGKTQKEVKEKLEDYKRKMSMGVLNEEKITIQDWFYTWLFDYRKQDLKPKSFDRYHGIYKNYILNTNLGKIKLCDLRTTHLQRHYKNLLDQGVTPTTIKQLNTNLKTCLGEAERQGYILKNWCKLVTLPKIEDNKEIKVLTKEEQTKFLAAIKGHELELLFIVALGTGLRLGELLGLKWCDIDFKNNTINIDKTMERIKVDSKYQWLIDTPKRPKSIRVIPLANRAKEQLLWLKTVSPGLEASGDDHIFVTKNNIPPSQSTLTRTLKAILKRADIESDGFGLHDLRHSFGSMLLQKGWEQNQPVDIKVISEILGHEDVSTTYNIYMHIMNKHKSEVINLLD